jgi:dTMP kinase
MKKGKLIVIDGSDGTGKATQAKLLVKKLKAEGLEVKVADFPRYGKKSAALVEDYLINKKYGHLNPYAASLLYVVDRFDASFEIRGWLAEGKIVVSNRYVTANAGHQGGKIKNRAERLEYFKWLEDIEYNIFNIPKPDLNIILHVPAEVAQKLAKNKWESRKKYMRGKKTDLHEEDLEHLKNAEKVYLEIAKIFPKTKLVECIVRIGLNRSLLTPKQVHEKLWPLVRRIL